MSKKILKAEYKGELNIGDIIISCAVLEDGSRILVERSLATALGVRGSGAYYKKKKEKKGALLPEYVSTKYLEPFISDEVNKKLLKTVSYIDKSGNIVDGISAEMLVDICDIWHQAYEKGALKNKPNALITAKQSYIIFKGFAKVGITALVDEATGYQYKRDKNDLQVILGAYISEEVAKWQLTFTEEFYDQIFRLWKQTYNKAKPRQSRPAFFGTLTNKYIYKPIQNGVVLDEIRQKASDDNNKARFHQYLTEDIGKKHLVKQITEVTVLMSICDDKNQFIELFRKKYDKNYQLSLFGDLPITSEKKKQRIPTELNNITKKVMDYKIDPNSPLPNNTFKKS